MVISELGVCTEWMQTDVQKLRSQLSQARRHITELSDRMQTLNTMWKGDANAAMKQRFQKDYDSLNDLCAFLEELIQVLETARQNYDSCDTQVSGMIAKLVIS